MDSCDAMVACHLKKGVRIKQTVKTDSNDNYGLWKARVLELTMTSFMQLESEELLRSLTYL